MKNFTVRLNEIRPDGEEWFFSPTENEKILEYLGPDVTQSDFNIHLKITPMGNVYQVEIDFAVEFALECAKCAFDFNFPTKKSCKEVIIVNRQSTARIEKQKNTSKDWSDTLFCTEVNSYNLDLSEFLRNIILTEAPTHPLAYGKDCESGSCLPFQERQKSGQYSSKNMKEWASEPQKNQFASLKNIVISDKSSKK